MITLTRLTRGARRGLALAGVAGVVALGTVPTAAAVEEPDPQYANPSGASAVCVGDVPYFDAFVDFGEPFAGEEATWQWLDADGNERLSGTLPLDSEGKAEIFRIWPGASVNPPDWPGWTLVDGEWVQDPTDEGAWTRYPEGVRTTLVASVNPTVSATISYPPASAICANPPNTPPPPGETPKCDDNPGDGVNDNLPPCTPPTPVCDETPGDGVNDDLPVCQELPATGANVGTAALVGAGLLAVGAGAVGLSRRRGAHGGEV